MAAQGGPAEWYAALPPITKAWFTSAILTGVAAKLEILDYKLLLLNWIKVIDKLHVRVGGEEQARHMRVRSVGAAAACAALRAVRR